jgi:hypothetical protein
MFKVILRSLTFLFLLVENNACCAAIAQASMINDIVLIYSLVKSLFSNCKFKIITVSFKTFAGQIGPVQPWAVPMGYVYFGVKKLKKLKKRDLS